jgi:GDPmannose 4,6-dehydratase
LKRALITGINGQDGSYLSEFLLQKDYEVFGTVKRNSVAENQTYRIDHIFRQVRLEYADLLDLPSLIRVVKLVQPHELYNLAAQSHVRISFDQPIYTALSAGIGTLNLLETLRLTDPEIKFYQASSSEMFGNSSDADGFQRESTPMYPVSPYGCAKAFAYNIVRNYRHSYKLFASNGILFNHESPRRGSNFVSNKVVKAAVEIKKGISNELVLGNLDSWRDWGHAKDYVKAMWLMLQHSEPDDFVCATGISHSVQELVEYVFNKLSLDWREYVKKSERYFRPEELFRLKGDATKIKTVLGWKPEISFEEMLDEMIDYWLNRKD